MNALLDVNIWIDIAARPERYPDSVKVYRALDKGPHSLHIALSSYTTIYYLLSKITTEDAARFFLESLETRGAQLARFTSEEVKLAQRFQIKDFEDACIAACALNNKCDVIVTRNMTDFKNSPIKARTPSSLLKDIN